MCHDTGRRIHAGTVTQLMFTGTEKLYRHFLDCSSIATDSRQIRSGSLFFALHGDTFDGNDFVMQALENGASYAVTDRLPAPGNPRILPVENSLRSLQQLATFHRKQFHIPVIAITGTNGKTTTKELIAAVLSARYKVTSTQGNLNNHIGVPLTLLRISDETRMVVVEMGANHPGEIDMLCRIALPDYGLITNIGKAHLEGFGGYDGVINTKTELYRFLAVSGGTLFVNGDDPLLMQHSENIQRILYGENEGFIHGKPAGTSPYAHATVSFSDGSLTIHSELFGTHNVINILAAACTGSYFGVPSPLICSAIGNYKPAMNRSEVRQTTSNLLILDAYNANPSSMHLALQSFRNSQYRSKTLILGDMLELGKDTENEHLAILRDLNCPEFEEVFLVGPVLSSLNTIPRFRTFNNTVEAGQWLLNHPLKDRTILLKGSRGIGLENLLPAL